MFSAVTRRVYQHKQAFGVCHELPVYLSTDQGLITCLFLQDSAVESTRHTLHTHLAPEASPQLHLIQGCHSQLQQLVGSNVAKLVAFNLGYLPGGDKKIITQAGSTVQAVEAALEV